MWEQLKPKHPSVIVFAQFEDFASLEVEKRQNATGSIVHYILNVNIFDITEQCADIVKLEDVEKAIVLVRKKIEDLYDEIPLLSDNEIEDWIDDFADFLGEL